MRVKFPSLFLIFECSHGFFQQSSLLIDSIYNRNSKIYRGNPLHCSEKNSCFQIETLDGGGSKLTVDVAGTKVIFETGRIGKQAHGSILSRDGDTMLYSTVCADKKPANLDFVPLKIDYQERFSSAGMTSGGYNKRDGRPSEKEVLVGRLIDRPIRPMIPEGWTHETQILVWVVSYDGVRPPEPLAITSSSAALLLSHVPTRKAVAGVTVAMDIDGNFIVYPNKDVMDRSLLNLTLAGTTEGVLMIEGSCEFLNEKQMINAIEIGHTAVCTLCEAIEHWAAICGSKKQIETLRILPSSLVDSMSTHFHDKITGAFNVKEKSRRSELISALSEEVLDMFDRSKCSDNVSELKIYESSEIITAFKKLCSTVLRNKILLDGTRSDGRTVDEVRPINCEVSVLPRTHGSALFTRGETQALATVTLGGSSMVQKIDGIDGSQSKRYYLQYTFPPSCVGEVGRMGAPSRREIGHGFLAERALSPIIPDENSFPYSVRVESLVTDSCGSSSMASVCGGCLALMDAGVPISKPIAGIAMGLLLNEDSSSDGQGIILTDILGDEDAFGTMDFKVAGDRDGITAFQLDIKCEGLTIELLTRALEQARVGRLHILNEMSMVLSAPRENLSKWVPIYTMFKVPVECIGRIIGPGGKQIRQTIEDYGLDDIDVSEDGTIFISSSNTEANMRAQKYIEALTGEVGKGKAVSKDSVPVSIDVALEVGKIYRNCEVKGVHNFGCFVEILDGIEGLVHVSELDVNHVRQVEGFMKIGDRVDVKYLGLNDKGKLRLSRKAVLIEDTEESKKERISPPEKIATN